ncbi:hypothetical protein DPX16_1018 [Anabarilius grahami]|uniref:Uncharacterized protein n=1 Tax=Anabarilius grahami TaxID=495550 RepID=A0A3N0ZAC6_ANAGA|nr:hypothetical protein DPX16_1018 [Anabarilius grahami]
MYNISVSCGEIQTDGGFEYRLHEDLLNQTVNGDCEQSWYSEVKRSGLCLHLLDGACNCTSPCVNRHRIVIANVVDKH